MRTYSFDPFVLFVTFATKLPMAAIAANTKVPTTYSSGIPRGLVGTEPLWAGMGLIPTQSRFLSNDTRSVATLYTQDFRAFERVCLGSAM